MAIYSKYLDPGLGRIIANTRPGRADIYLDGDIVMDTSGRIAKTPTVVHNVSEGMHTLTFSKAGYNDITLSVNIVRGSDCHARAILDTSKWSYPLMLSPSNESLQPSPGWPYIPTPETTFGHIVADTLPDGAKIYIDGQPVLDINGNIATTPASVIGIVTGTHTVTFKKDGYADTSVMVNIENGLYSDVYVTLK